MIYEFVCDKCGYGVDLESEPFVPPKPPLCKSVFKCGSIMRRIYNAQIDTTGCQDADFIPEEKRLCPNPHGMTKSQADKRTRKYAEGIRNRRRQLADGNKGSIKQSHAVPAELYHGKIKQTGDRHYWQDPKNLNRHKSCKVDDYGQ